MMKHWVPEPNRTDHRYARGFFDGWLAGIFMGVVVSAIAFAFVLLPAVL